MSAVAGKDGRRAHGERALRGRVRGEEVSSLGPGAFDGPFDGAVEGSDPGRHTPFPVAFAGECPESRPGAR